MPHASPATALLLLLLVGHAFQIAVTFHPGPEKPTLSDLFTSQAMVEVTPAASADPHLPLLATLGWYLMLLHRDDAGAVAAGAEHA